MAAIGRRGWRSLWLFVADFAERCDVIWTARKRRGAVRGGGGMTMIIDVAA